MSNFRFTALKKTLDRPIPEIKYPSKKVSDYFGSMTFNNTVMREYLTEQAYEVVQRAIEKGERIERKITDQIASAMKAWAMGKGVSHYTHWFHPLTGATAEKRETNPYHPGRADVDSVCQTSAPDPLQHSCPE